jgi:cytochrome c oxidase assembly protein subunit 15
MNASVAAYDLSPAAWLLLLGAALALGPLAWVWRKHHGRSPLAKAQALTVLTLFLTFDLLLFGAFTRLTDSGLGCPDWPGCYGHSSPLGAQAHIAAAQQAMPTGPVTHDKAWVEMLHRYLATAVGGLILVLAVMAWWQAWQDRKAGRVPVVNPWWPTLTLGWVCLQGAFGALTVTMKLFPAIVTLHLLGAMALLVLLAWQVARLNRLLPGAALPVAVSPGLRHLLGLGLALLVLQISLGAWVSTNYAVLACSDFPTCQGGWWPEMDFAQGFTLWRPLGLTAGGAPIVFAALTAIHYTHRAMAAVVLVLLGLLAWQLNRVPGLRTLSRWLAVLLGLQLATGLGNVVLGWPLAAALLHTGGAGALVLVLTWALCASRAVQRDDALQTRLVDETSPRRAAPRGLRPPRGAANTRRDERGGLLH